MSTRLSRSSSIVSIPMTHICGGNATASPYNGHDFTNFKNKKRGKYALLIPIIGGTVFIGIIILISVITFTNKN
ncbi:hypothetical protein EPVG_00308 [Emiliania huxleyi virus 201]|nr:hypothetical protein EQVG_00303 [Emiliania huxleyi virus 207]AEP16155.1 hypothetical protein ERVG_00280 [Emiliania huxleyi virus 208]AET98195.1 hypothetical protein EPVG_00308 [Emiliania huxleyi virus 201]